MHAPALHRELTHHQYLRERLKAEFPDADEETLMDTLEGLTKSTDLLAEVLRSQLDDQDLVAEPKARIGDMQVRAGRIDERARKKRELVRSVMERADLKKLMEPDLTVSPRPTRAPLAVIDEEAVPEEFWQPQPPMSTRKGLSQLWLLAVTFQGPSSGIRT